MIKALAHVCIHTTDLEATRRFYCDGLGCTKRFDFVRKGEVFGFYLHIAGEMYVEVFRADTLPPKGNLIGHFCFETDDMDGLMARMKAAGYAVKDKIMGDDHTWQFWAKDPSGIDIEFQQYTDRSTQRTGEPCVVKW